MEFKRTGGRMLNNQLHRLTRDIKSVSGDTLLEEEKVEGDLYNRRLSMESRQNGNAGFQADEQVNSSPYVKKDFNIFGQVVDNGEEIA